MYSIIAVLTETFEDVTPKGLPGTATYNKARTGSIAYLWVLIPRSFPSEGVE